MREALTRRLLDLDLLSGDDVNALLSVQISAPWQKSGESLLVSDLIYSRLNDTDKSATRSCMSQITPRRPVFRCDVRSRSIQIAC